MKTVETKAKQLKEWLIKQYSMEQITDLFLHGPVGKLSKLCDPNFFKPLYQEFACEIWAVLKKDAKSIGFRTVLDFITHLAGDDKIETANKLEFMLLWYVLRQITLEMVNSEENSKVTA